MKSYEPEFRRSSVFLKSPNDELRWYWQPKFQQEKCGKSVLLAVFQSVVVQLHDYFSYELDTCSSHFRLPVNLGPVQSWQSFYSARIRFLGCVVASDACTFTKLLLWRDKFISTNNKVRRKSDINRSREHATSKNPRYYWSWSWPLNDCRNDGKY